MEFTEIVETLEPKLRGIACNITNNKTGQDDLLQEGWLRHDNIEFISLNTYDLRQNTVSKRNT